MYRTIFIPRMINTVIQQGHWRCVWKSCMECVIISPLTEHIIDFVLTDNQQSNYLMSLYVKNKRGHSPRILSQSLECKHDATNPVKVFPRNFPAFIPPYNKLYDNVRWIMIMVHRRKRCATQLIMGQGPASQANLTQLLPEREREMREKITFWWYYYLTLITVTARNALSD